MSATPKQRQNKELTDFQHVRLKTEMYLGSRETSVERFVVFKDNKLQLEEVEYVPALLTAFREILDNAVDEIVGNKSGNSIVVTFDPKTLRTSVSDNGAGIPQKQIEMVFTKLRAGSNFGTREEVVGTNGVGASVVAYCSSEFNVEVVSGKSFYKQKFTEGHGNNKYINIEKPKIIPTTHSQGTRVEFIPSPKVFNNFILPEILVSSRIKELSFIYPKVKFIYNGNIIKGQDFFLKYEPIIITANDLPNNFRSTFYVIPNFHEGTDEHAHAVVNGVGCYRGGEHIKAFQRKFFSGLIDNIKPESRKAKVAPNRNDIAAGLLVFSVTQMHAPSFDSQSKTFLINQNAAKFVDNGLSENMFRGLKKKYPEWIESIIERAKVRMSSKGETEAARITKKAAKTRVAKLTDASGKDRSKCVLIIGEGNSAINGIIEERNPELHGSMPLRGKILNVFDCPAAEAFKSEALSDIVSALGLVYGKKASPDTLRYGQLWVATDEDVDGYHILCLVVNFLYRFWPELFEGGKPFVSKIETPFIILKKGKERKYIYQCDYKGFKPDNHKGWEVTRAKGLGTLEGAEWKDLLAKPRLISFKDNGHMRTTLDLMFNPNRADDRKTWLEE